jgi:hypothetical protein
MRRGTTPVHSFTLPMDTSTIKKLRVTYAQQGGTILTKTEEDVVLAGNTVKLQLTQTETLKFRCTCDVLIEIKILTHAGDAQSSDILRVSVESCLCEEELE